MKSRSGSKGQFLFQVLTDTSEPAAVVKFQPGKFELGGGGAQKNYQKNIKLASADTYLNIAQSSLQHFYDE
jgi:hypothetical protein